MDMGWIDRKQQEPNAEEHPVIIVWGEGSWPHGVVACKLYDDGDAEDVIDGVQVEFRYWMPAPPPPK